MSRYLCILPVVVLIWDFVWWFQYAHEKGAIPEFGMTLVHIAGIFILGALVGSRAPSRLVGGLGLIWCVLFLVQSVSNFQQFGFAGFVASWVAPFFLFGLVVSPALVRSYASIKNS